MDRELVRRARDGDRAAFASVVTASIDSLDRVARLITRNPERAQDAVQEALIKAWRDLPSLRDVDRFDAWLRPLLVRSCLTSSAATGGWAGGAGPLAPCPP